LSDVSGEMRGCPTGSQGTCGQLFVVNGASGYIARICLCSRSVSSFPKEERRDAFERSGLGKVTALAEREEALELKYRKIGASVDILNRDQFKMKADIEMLKNC